MECKPYFIDFEDLDKQMDPCTENTALYLVNIWQYWAVCIAMNISSPYRKPIYTNCALTFSLLLVMAFQTSLLFAPDIMANFSRQFLFVSLTLDTKWMLCGMIALNVALTYTIEKVICKIVDQGWLNFSKKTNLVS